MLNGNTLKIAFLIIVGTLCAVFAVLTIGTGFKFIPLPDYVQLLGEMGLIGIFTQIVQAFIHYNQNGGSNEKSNPISAPVVVNAPVITSTDSTVKQ